MTKVALRLVKPISQNRTVATPRRPKNEEMRTREHLTPAEVDRLIDAAKRNRWGHRDAAMVLMAYRHGFRASELVDLEWSQVDFDHQVLHVRRVKKGSPATHPLQGDTMRALRRLRRDAPNATFVFLSERGAPFSAAGFAKMVERAGREAAFAFKVHPHMLRHACGYKLANDGKDTRSLQAYLGHKNIRHTVTYTALSPTAFKDFWKS
jgi:integrase